MTAVCDRSGLPSSWAGNPKTCRGLITCHRMAPSVTLLVPGVPGCFTNVRARWSIYSRYPPGSCPSRSFTRPWRLSNYGFQLVLRAMALVLQFVLGGGHLGRVGGCSYGCGDLFGHDPLRISYIGLDRILPVIIRASQLPYSMVSSPEAAYEVRVQHSWCNPTNPLYMACIRSCIWTYMQHASDHPAVWSRCS